MKYYHEPVLTKEIIQYLDPQPNQDFIDCTIGGGGHAEEILKRTDPKGKLLGIDLDAKALEFCRERLKRYKSRLILAQNSYKNIKKIAYENQLDKIDGILLDLGLSLAQLRDISKGLSYQIKAPLDMRFGSSAQKGLTAKKILNSWPQKKIENILRQYGEERFARSISKNICRSRKEKKIENTERLVEIIKKSVPAGYRRGKTHFATRTFQALRIAVNDELNNLISVLPDAVELLKPGGIIAVISFHSLEDRIVKNFFKRESKKCICPPQTPICACGHEKTLKILTKKVVKPSREEILKNPKSRSAKLRAAEKI